VKLLLNMNVLPQLGSRLAAVGHLCRHARDIGLERAEDPGIIAAARAGGEIIVTHDLDYGHLLAFSGEAGPSVIIFRVRNTLSLMKSPLGLSSCARGRRIPRVSATTEGSNATIAARMAVR
jgi:predicted nuclease of predicted toxin-antitoxin system